MSDTRTVVGVLDQFENVGALDGIAAGEDEDRYLHLCDLVDEPLALRDGELKRVALGLRTGAAVDARQIASLRYFPNHDIRSLRKVDRNLFEIHAAIAAGAVDRRCDQSLGRRFFFPEAQFRVAVTEVIWHE